MSVKNDGGFFLESEALKRFLIFAAIIVLCFSIPLYHFVKYASQHDLHSHCVLIPLVTIYLLWTSSSFRNSGSEKSLRSGLGVTGIGVGLAVYLISPISGDLLEGDRISWWVFSFLLCLVGAFIFCFGWKVLKSEKFPIGFLFFTVPLLHFAAEWLEVILMVCSAVASHWFFDLFSVPAIREGQIIEIPGIVLEVARECSGIRSTWVLFITSTLAAYLFLRHPLHRVLLVCLVFPLGVFRNALRILVIGKLCVSKGPEMIDSWIHREGGPIFFGVSLIPLFTILGVFFLLEKRKATEREAFIEKA